MKRCGGRAAGRRPGAVRRGRAPCTPRRQDRRKAAPSPLVAEVNLAILRFERGEREEANRGFRRLIAAYNARDALSSEELVAVGIACRYLGADDPQLFKDALKAFDEAIAADPGNMDARVRLAELFLEKYNGADAREDARGGAASGTPSTPARCWPWPACATSTAQPGVLDLWNAALAVEPEPGRRPACSRPSCCWSRRTSQARPAQAEASLAKNPASLPALAVLAAARYLQGDQAGFEEARKKALAANPRNAEFYNRLAERLRAQPPVRRSGGLRRRRRWRSTRAPGGASACSASTSSASGHIEAARREPRGVLQGRPLQRLDQEHARPARHASRSTRETKTPHFRLLVHGKESALLAPYVGGAGRGGLRAAGRALPLPARPRPSGSRSIRATATSRCARSAWPGWARSACASATCSPSTRRPRARSASSTGARRSGTSWPTPSPWARPTRRCRAGSARGSPCSRSAGRGRAGATTSPLEFLRALQARQAPAAGQLNDGFVRPTGPDQVAISYYQASLRGRSGSRPSAASRPSSSCSPRIATAAPPRRPSPRCWARRLEDFDRAFFAHLQDAIRRRARQPRRVREAQRAAGAALYQQKKLAEARAAPRARAAAFPEYGGDDNPYWYLAAHLQGAGRTDEGRGSARRSSPPSTRATTRRTSSWPGCARSRATRRAPRPPSSARSTSGRSSPACTSAWPRSTRGWGTARAVVRARRSLVALDPVDRPEALYQLALALVEAGDAAQARREVLRALELAPRFQRAQELLLRLHRGRRRRAAAHEGLGARGWRSSPAGATAARRRPARRRHATRTRPTTGSSPSCASASSRRAGAPATTCGASTSSGTTTTRARRPTS